MFREAFCGPQRGFPTAPENPADVRDGQVGRCRYVSEALMGIIVEAHPGQGTTLIVSVAIKSGVAAVSRTRTATLKLANLAFPVLPVFYNPEKLILGVQCGV